MTTIEAELPDGRILEFPAGTDTAVIQNAVRQMMGTRMQRASQDDSAIGQAFAKIPGADVVSEFASGAVRGVSEGIDFLTTDAFNAAAKLAGSDVRAPRLTDALQERGAGVEGFMEPGTAQQVVSTAGEFAPAFTGVVGAARGAPSLADDVVRRVRGNDVSEFIQQGRQRAGELSRGERRLADKVAAIQAGDVDVAKSTVTPEGRVVRDSKAASAINQGFDPGVVSAVRTGSVKDRQNLRRMAEIKRRGMQNRRFEAVHRPSDVVGESITDRLKVLTRANRKAGAQVGHEARKLERQGAQLDFSSPIDDFFDEMSANGVRMGDDGLEFVDSRFEDVPAAERILKVVAKRAERLRDSGSASKAHDLKQFIDEHVAYGKSEGLSGRAEAMVKDLRRNLDGLLDANFEGYRKANETYAETIEVLNSLQREAGSKIDITGRNAEKALGTLARTIMSNNRGRQPLLNALEDLNTVAARQGATFDDDIVLQALFADELDTVFKPSARTSLAGDVAKTAVREGTPGLTRQALEAGVDTVMRRNDANAIKAIQSFLDEL